MKKITRARTKIILVGLAVLLGLGIWVKAHYFSAPKNDFLTTPVIKGDLEDAVLATGILEALTQVDVGAQASGQLKSLKVALGDTVKKGQLLAEIDPVLQQNDLRNAEAQLDNVLAQQRAKQALLKQAELTLERQQKMISSNATSYEELESAQANVATTRADLATLEAQIRQARIQMDTAKANLGYTRISAPMDGDVVGIITKQGQTVVSTQTAPTILILADVATMTVKAQISEADVIRVKPDQAVYFTILGAPEKRFHARLRAIEPAPESINTTITPATTTNTAVYYNGLFDVPNPDHVLRISMTAQVSIVLGEAKDVLIIPAAALGARDKESRYQVRVLAAGGQVQTRQIKVGLNNNVNAQVLDGLKEGENVVVGKGMIGDEEDEGGNRPSRRH